MVRRQDKTGIRTQIVEPSYNGTIVEEPRLPLEPIPLRKAHRASSPLHQCAVNKNQIRHHLINLNDLIALRQKADYSSRRMTRMPILNELIISIVGGVATALILSIFTGRGRRADVPAHANRHTQVQRSGRSGFGDFIRIILSVVGGIAIALYGGRILFEAGLLEQGLPSRLGLLIAGTAICWLLLVSLRRR